MSNKYAVVSGSFFGLVAVVQAVRAWNQVPVQIGSLSVPVGVSWLITLAAGGMCVWGFRSRGR